MLRSYETLELKENVVDVIRMYSLIYLHKFGSFNC